MRLSGFIVVIDAYLVRKGMISLLSRIQGIRIIRELDSPKTFQQYAARENIDFLVISQSIFDRSSEVFLSHPELLERTLLLKSDSDSKPQVPHAIYLYEGKEQIEGKIKRLLDIHATQASRILSSELSLREKTIVRQVSLGLTNKQIAEELFLSTHTVITHRKNISSKLGIKSVSGLTVYAIVNNIITIEEVSSKPTD